MRRTSIVIISVALLAYYLFTSGFVFEVSKSTTTNFIDLPYSFSFSAQRVNLIGIATQDDLKGAEWLATTSRTIPIQSGYDGTMIAWGYGLHVRRALITYEGTRYVFVTTWETQHNQRNMGANGGLRLVNELPEYDEKDLVFQSGDSKVYFIQ